MKATSAPRVSVAREHPPAAVDEDERDGQGGQELDGRVEDRVVEDRGHVGVGVLAVDGGEGLAVARLAAEELHHGHAREVLLQEGVDARHPLAAPRGRSARAPAPEPVVTTKKSGSTEKVTRASRQFRASITPMIPKSVKRSPNTVTTPEVKSSFTASTSVVTRVMSRPTGFRSK